MTVEAALLELEQLRSRDKVALVVRVPDATVRAHAEARGAAHAVGEQLELAGRFDAYGPAIEAAPRAHDIAAALVRGTAAVMHEVQREVVRAVLAAHGAVH